MEKLGNIGPVGQRRRRFAGMVAIAGAVVMFAGLEVAGASRWWRAGLFPVLWFGLAGLVQAQQRTCIALAARGTCDADAGIGRMTPETERLFRVRAKHMLRLVTLLAAVATLAALAIP